MTEASPAVRLNSEVSSIPDIRERNDRPKDRQTKHPITSAAQRQMVQKFVIELNDSAKQSDRSDSAERAATEQVETAVHEITHEAVQLPHRVFQHHAHKESAASSDHAQPEQPSQPRHEPEATRKYTDVPRTRSDSSPLQSVPAPVPQEQARRAYLQRAANTTVSALPIMPEQPQAHYPAAAVPTAENAPRQRTDDLRLRPEQLQPQRKTAPEPQEQGQRAYVQQAKKSRAEKSSVRDISYREQPEIRLTDDLPQRKPPLIREKPDVPELCSQSRSEAAPAKPSAVRHAKQPGAWTPRSAAVPVLRGKDQPIREPAASAPTHNSPSSPQIQQAFAEKQKQLSQNPSIDPSQPAASFPSQLPASDTPAITPERQPVTSGSGKSASTVPLQSAQPPVSAQAPPAEQLPAVREKQKPNAAPREKFRRSVDIRTRETAPPSARKVQPAPSVPGTAAKWAKKVATQNAQRKMLQKSNKRTARAAVAATKKLAEAAEKAVKALINALLRLGGGTVLLIVFSILIVAGALLASPLGILFADEQESDDTVPLATAIAEIQGEYHAKLEELQIGDLASVQIVGQAPDWREVVAVFASKTAGSEDGVDVFTLDAARVELLRQVFWDMCQISTQTDTTQNEAVEAETALTITITAKTAEQMRLEYAFSMYQNNALDVLLENLGSLHIPMGSLTISQEDAIVLLENLPDDLDPARKAVVETALQLVGKVSYFWGGKSLVLGWDDRWGVPTEVTAAGSGSTGTVRPFGLDCSGFVGWVFYNATNGAYYPGHGGGAATQHSYCTDIPWSEAQPGDLVFYPDDSHVGIVGGTDADGNLLIIHCSSGANGVVITGSAGFTAVARPGCY